ncbi:MAG: hypothetical protein IPF99_12755 [Deltaproteobacteria bacterium]|nr:hypothetical protein [Deltaproteobacteria bacterium]
MSATASSAAGLAVTCMASESPSASPARRRRSGRAIPPSVSVRAARVSSSDPA